MSYASKEQKKNSNDAASRAAQNQNNAASALQFIDNRPEAVSQRKTQEAANKTGLPDNLKSGVESLSGISMDDVKVHYNSSKPSQLQAHAYTQGSDIHVASGQEKHVAHEAWHVVQQKQGRVQPTVEVAGQKVNDDRGLESEADVMGGKALQMKAMEDEEPKPSVQRVSIEDEEPKPVKQSKR